MSALAPFNSALPIKPLKRVASLRGEKADSVPVDDEYIGLEQIESWTGRLSGAELLQHPEGGANTFLPGDILFGKLRPYLAKGWAADRAGYCTTEALVLQSQEADPRFLRYCILSEEFVEAVNSSTYGSKMPRADWSFIGAIQVPCPERETQTRIANFLDEHTARIDALIAEKEGLLEKLSELTNAQIAHEMGGGWLSDTATHYDWYPSIPSTWRVVPFKHAVKFIEGPGILATDFQDSGVPLLRVSCVRGDEVTLDGCNYLDPAKVEKTWKHFQVKRGDLLISASASMGTVSLVTEETEGSIPYTGIIILRPIAGVATRDFVRNFVVSDQFMRQIDNMKAGATIQHFGPTHLNRVLMAAPLSLSEQDEIASRLDKWRGAYAALLSHTSEHISRLREYRSSLISAAVTGQLDINSFTQGCA